MLVGLRVASITSFRDCACAILLLMVYLDKYLVPISDPLKTVTIWSFNLYCIGLMLLFGITPDKLGINSGTYVYPSVFWVIVAKVCFGSTCLIIYRGRFLFCSDNIGCIVHSLG